MYIDVLIWSFMQENLTLLHANNKGADQPAICAVWLAPLLFADWKVSYLNLLQAKLVSVAEETGLIPTLLELPEDRFWPIYTRIPVISIYKSD